MIKKMSVESIQFSKNMKLVVLCFIFIFLLPANSFSLDWPLFRGNLFHTGFQDEVINLPLEFVFKIPTTKEVYSSPAIVNGVLYVGGKDKKVYAIDAKTGNIKWTKAIIGEVEASPCVKDGVVYIGTTYRPEVPYPMALLYGLDANTGTTLYYYWLYDGVPSSPICIGDRIYVGCYDGKLYAFDKYSSEAVWMYPLDFILFSSPAVRGNEIYIGSYDKGLYALIDKGSYAELKWRYYTTGLIYSSPSLSDNLVAVGSRDNKIYAVDINTGSLLWEYATGGAIWSSPAIANNKIYIGSNDTYIYAIDINTGSLVWRYKTDGIVRSSPAITKNNLLFCGSNDGNLYVLDSETGELKQKIYIGSMIRSSPAISGGYVYFGAGDGIYGFKGQELLVLITEVKAEPDTIYPYKDGHPGNPSESKISFKLVKPAKVTITAKGKFGERTLLKEQEYQTAGEYSIYFPGIVDFAEVVKESADRGTIISKEDEFTIKIYAKEIGGTAEDEKEVKVKVLWKR